VQGQPAGLVEAAQRQLERLGVTVRTGKVVEVSSAGPANPRCADLSKTIVLETDCGQERMRSDLVLWTAGPHHYSQCSLCRVCRIARVAAGMGSCRAGTCVANACMQ
jgi:hypothetical protein